MENVSDILAFGIPAIAIVAGLVEFSKKFGAAGNLCTILAVVYAIILGLLTQLAVVFPAIEPWVRTVFTYLLIGLASSGLFDMVKNFISTRNVAMAPKTEAPKEQPKP